MKKTYINPTLKVVNIRPMQMVMTSPGVPVDTNAEPGDQSQSDARRARFQTWDEDME